MMVLYVLFFFQTGNFGYIFLWENVIDWGHFHGCLHSVDKDNDFTRFCMLRNWLRVVIIFFFIFSSFPGLKFFLRICWYGINILYSVTSLVPANSIWWPRYFNVVQVIIVWRRFQTPIVNPATWPTDTLYLFSESPTFGNTFFLTKLFNEIRDNTKTNSRGKVISLYFEDNKTDLLIFNHAVPVVGWLLFKFYLSLKVLQNSLQCLDRESWIFLFSCNSFSLFCNILFFLPFVISLCKFFILMISCVLLSRVFSSDDDPDYLFKFCICPVLALLFTCKLRIWNSIQFYFRRNSIWPYTITKIKSFM